MYPRLLADVRHYVDIIVPRNPTVVSVGPDESPEQKKVRHVGCIEGRRHHSQRLNQISRVFLAEDVAEYIIDVSCDVDVAEQHGEGAEQTDEHARHAEAASVEVSRHGSGGCSSPASTEHWLASVQAVCLFLDMHRWVS